jgi:hypothetical protein
MRDRVADSRRNAEALVRRTVCAPVGNNQVLPMLQGLAQGVGGHIDLVSDDRCVIVGLRKFGVRLWGLDALVLVAGSDRRG